MTELASGKLVMDEPAEGVVRLRIANPERRGALDHEILDALAETVRSLDAPCLLLTGTGKVFSAGYDLGNLEGRSSRRPPRSWWPTPSTRPSRRWTPTPTPSWRR